MTGPAPIGDRVFNEPGFCIVLGKEFGLAFHQVGGMGFERFRVLCVQLLSNFTK